jgi:hypothetical protein
MVLSVAAKSVQSAVVRWQEPRSVKKCSAWGHVGERGHLRNAEGSKVGVFVCQWVQVSKNGAESDVGRRRTRQNQAQAQRQILGSVAWAFQEAAPFRCAPVVLAT